MIELRSLMRTMLRSVAICAAVLFLAQRMCCHALAAAETPPNTLITNTASATYTDPTGVVYTVSSNAVSTTVQNAPLLTIAATAAQTVSPGETVIDTFTVTNNGNATGAITLDTPSIAGPGTESNLYVLDGAATGPCSVAAPCSLATLNTQPALTVSAVGTSITVGVIYVASSSATPGSTIATTLSGSIKQAAVGGAPAATSPIATATDTDTVLADARLDLYKTAIPPSSQTAPITYTIEGNNGGGFGAKALVSAGRLLGLPASPGVIAVLDAIPRFAGASTQTTIVSAPPVPALPAGDTGTVYYSTSTDGLSGWSPAFSATANFIALFVTTTNPAGIVFPSDPAGSTGAGVAQSASQFVLTFQITQPVESGAANAGSLKNIANSIIGGNPGGAGTPIIAPRVPVDSSYETATAPVPLSVFANTTINTTPSTGAPAPGGASNVVLTAAFANHEVLNGPLDNAAATGSYNGTVGVSTQNDFTAATFACANGSATATISCTWPAGGVAIPNTIANPGNGTDTFFIYAAAPAGYTVQLFAVTGCPATTPATIPIAPYGTGCVIGGALSPISGSGGSVTTTAGIAIGAALTYDYVALFAPANGTMTLPNTPLIFSTIAYGSGAVVTAGAPTLGADANQTFNVIYPGGPLQINKFQTIVGNCTGKTPAASSPTALCPGGTITYSLVYKNVAPASLAAGGASVGTEPPFALAGMNGTGGTVVDDGTPAGSWAANTFGIDAVVAPVIPAGATATYTPAAMLSTGTYPAKTQGPTKLSVAIPGLIAPGATGTISFQVTVK